MIDSIDHDLVTWVGRVLPDVPVALDPPSAAEPERPGVGLYLLELRQHPPLRGSRPEPLRLWARYLVHAWAPSPAEAHGMLFELAFSALEREDLDVDLDPPDPDVWLALGVAPRPCFRVGVPVRRARVSPRCSASSTRWSLARRPSAPSAAGSGRRTTSPSSVPRWGSRRWGAAL